MKNKNIVNDGGIQGLGTGIIDTNSEDFKYLQKKIIEESKKLTKEQVLKTRLLSLRFQMETYLREDNTEIKKVGFFLKECVKALGIKNKVFAKYIDYKESNLSSLYKGNRKINIDLAIKLGKIFKIAPAFWLQIQSKNELKRMEAENEQQYLQYSMEDLLRKAS